MKKFEPGLHNQLVVIDLVNREINAKLEEIISHVLTQLLKREPTREEVKQAYTIRDDNRTSLYYQEVLLGGLDISFDGPKITIHFFPDRAFTGQ